jgi:hypothetical protein
MAEGRPAGVGLKDQLREIFKTPVLETEKRHFLGRYILLMIRRTGSNPSSAVCKIEVLVKPLVCRIFAIRNPLILIGSVLRLANALHMVDRRAY